DDQDLIRLGLRTLVDSEDGLAVAGEAADGLEAVAAARRHRPDVVLMDIRMPTMDGVTATRRISAAGEVPRVLILTTFDLDELVYDALEAGAAGFLLKDVKADVLADAIRVVHRGDALLAPSVTRRLIGQFVAARPRVVLRPSTVEGLTPRETEVLVLIAQGLSNAEIAESLVVSGTTVKTHVGRVFAKIGARDRAQAVVRAYQLGLVPLDGPQTT
ncbi:MAG: response regulator transcription factor, partial [Nocardioidaceae bacterium]|nr:response regulator transcription factor [Nocardioidaceae bacterium]